MIGCKLMGSILQANLLQVNLLQAILLCPVVLYLYVKTSLILPTRDPFVHLILAPDRVALAVCPPGDA